VIARTDGSLSVANSYATGGVGLGTAEGLPSQGSVLLSPDGNWLFVCNAGSDDISVFETLPGGELQLTDRVGSGGKYPLSLALNGSLLYVLNAGGYVGASDNITAFHFGCGNLTMLPGSSRTVGEGASAGLTGPAGVAFGRDGDELVVTERGLNAPTNTMIDTWVLDQDGMATNHQVFTAGAGGNFGFAVGRGNRLYVSEAAGGAANGSAVSAYALSDSGGLTVLDASVGTKQTAACWVALTFDNRFLYTANAGSATVSGFSVRQDGSLELLNSSGASGATGAHPADMAFSHNGQMLFVLDNGSGMISAFGIGMNGSLTSLSGLSGLPTTAAGLAAW
jgi:6-phosphogluconolactonase (cycloisomerase 2 family)